MKERCEKKLQIIWHLVFAATMVFLLWKCRYGYAFSDEAFYLTIPYRLCLGDKLILQEWHLSQMTAFLTLPLVKIYLMLAGGTEAVFLHFRIIFTLIWGMAGYFFYRRLRRFSMLGSMLGSLMFLVFTPFGIMALGYNSLGILLMINAGVMTASNESGKPGWDMAGGLSFAGAVMCCPYLAIIYLAGTVMELLRVLRKKEKRFRRWIIFSGGCLLLLLLFLAYLFTHGTWQEYLQVFPRLLEDPEHNPQGLPQKMVDYLKTLLTANAAVIPCLIGSAACWLFLRKKRADFSFALVCCMSGIVMLCFRGSYYNNIMLAINLAGLYCGLSGKDQELRQLFRCLFVPGAAYTFCLYLSSNQRLYAITMASAVMTFVSPVLMIMYLLELNRETVGTVNGRRIAAGICAGLMVVQLAWEYRLRYTVVFGEVEMGMLNTRIAEGSEKGLWTTGEQAGDARWMEADAAVIREREEQKLLVLDPDNVPMYLSAEKEIAAYSAWLSGLNEGTIQRLEGYESLRPEKQPDLVYLPAWNSDWAESYLRRGYRKQVLPSGAWLLSR